MLWFKTRVARGALAALVISTMGSYPRCFAQKDNPDYSLGQPRVWIYQRVYPFLDGIFQDVASTQVAPLVLSANGANASQLNAVQTSWGVGVNYSATAQMQNALAAQQTQLMSANTQVQSALLTQQTQLTQQLVTATQAQGQAQAALAQLQAQPNPDPTQLAAEQAVVTAATNNVTTLTSELNLVKAQIPATVPTFSAPSAQAPSVTGLPSAISGLTSPPGAPPTPTFPVSKQMDNQVNLLWERLSRLVSTLAQADSLHNFRLVLAGFDVNLMPDREDKKVFAVEYTVSASVDRPGYVCKGNPLVVDMFPSASAVNIVNNQYKDSRGAIGAALSWMGWGLNASYNREHLQMSQALGQSAYITGYGAGVDTFGWAFGRNLTDKSVSPGKRTVFAIIAVPIGCENVSIHATRRGWFDEKSDSWYSNRDRDTKRFRASLGEGSITGPVGGIEGKSSIASVVYTPVEFDPTAATPAISSLRIDFYTPVDPQLEISVNGQLIPRVRDTFARAVQNAGGSGGLLESISYTTNTWVATSSQTITMWLDPSKFSRGFPDIAFLSPSNVRPLNESALLPEVDLDGKLVDGKVKYIVGGENFGCVAPCESDIPPLGYRKATWQTLSAFEVTDPTDTSQTVVLSLPSDVSNVSSSAAASGSVQVLAAAPSPWGGNVLVMASVQGQENNFTGTKTSEQNPDGTQSNEQKAEAAQKENENLQLVRLSCHPVRGTVRLVCRARAPLDKYLGKPVTIEVHDADHTGGPVSAQARVEAHGGFIVWSLGQPRWVTSNDVSSTPSFVLCAEFMNYAEGDEFALGSASGTPVNRLNFSQNLPECPSHANLWSGGVKMSLDQYMSLTDQMTIVHLNSMGGSTDDPAATLLNLHAAGEPVVNVASSDFLQWYGQNLVFGKQMQIGGGKAVPMACDPAGSSCQVMPPPAPAAKAPAPAAGKTPAPAAAAAQAPAKTANAAGAQKNPLGNAGGPIYIVYTGTSKHSFIIPVLKNTNGTIAPFQYTPPSSGGGGGGGAGGGQMSFGMTITASSNGAPNQPALGQQPVAGVAPVSPGSPTTPANSASPATAGTKPAGVSPMSTIVVQ